MITLQRPKLNRTCKEIYELCVSDFSRLSCKADLMLCSSNVETDAQWFAKDFPNNLCEVKKNPSLPGGMKQEQMKKVYEQKFVSLDSPGRIYYDTLMAAPKGGKCPICGERLIKQLDHYMPKAQYYTLIVAPDNLVPTCRDCNFDKYTYTFDKPDEAPLHPYFDNIEQDIWLTAKLQQNEIALYEVECPEHWSKQLKSRVEKHLGIYGLNEFYSIKAAQEVADEKYFWKQMLLNGGYSDLKQHFEQRCESIEKNNLNSWKAALYRGLVSQFNIVQGWTL